MNLDNGGMTYRPAGPRESYAVKLARAEARAEKRCPGTTKKGEPCQRPLGQCQWHKVEA